MLFKSRVELFISNKLNSNRYDIDLYKGYVVHLLTDELYILTIRQEFIKSTETNKDGKKDLKYFSQMIEDAKVIDQIFSSTMSGKEELIKQLEAVEYCEVEGFLSNEMIMNSKKWIIENKLKVCINIDKPKSITVERMEKFIETSAKDIIEQLSSAKKYQRIL